MFHFFHGPEKYIGSEKYVLVKKKQKKQTEARNICTHAPYYLLVDLYVFWGRTEWEWWIYLSRGIEVAQKYLCLKVACECI